MIKSIFKHNKTTTTGIIVIVGSITYYFITFDLFSAGLFFISGISSILSADGDKVLSINPPINTKIPEDRDIDVNGHC